MHREEYDASLKFVTHIAFYSTCMNCVNERVDSEQMQKVMNDLAQASRTFLTHEQMEEVLENVRENLAEHGIQASFTQIYDGEDFKSTIEYADWSTHGKQ